MFIVVYNDDIGDMSIPMEWDSDCEGALCSWTGGKVVVFADRNAAKKAIAISTLFAKLCKLQGRLANEDFLDYRKHIRIVACTPNGQPKPATRRAGLGFR